jgi:hypothetical protein
VQESQRLRDEFAEWVGKAATIEPLPLV